MANKYSQIFTLLDIFNNKELEKKLPIINYKEVWTSGVRSRTTSGKTVNKLVFDTAKASARPFYKPLVGSKNGDTIEIGGTLVGDYDEAYNSIYNGIKDIRQLLSFTANNADMIRSALKEAEKNKRKTGINNTLYLRVQSMQEIKNLDKKQMVAFMNNIMENIMFSDNYKETQKKFGVRSWDYDMGSRYKVYGTTMMRNYKHRTYEQAKEQWERKVGII